MASAVFRLITEIINISLSLYNILISLHSYIHVVCCILGISNIDPTECAPLAIGTHNIDPDFFIVYRNKVLIHKGTYCNCIFLNLMLVNRIQVLPSASDSRRITMHQTLAE